MFSEIPIFFERILKIYLNGHIITGWKGKFPYLPQHIFNDKPIDNKEGTLLIW